MKKSIKKKWGLDDECSEIRNLIFVKSLKPIETNEKLWQIRAIVTVAARRL